jgi:hypothetical protein
VIPFEKHLNAYEGKMPPPLPATPRKKASNAAVWVIGIVSVLAIIGHIGVKSDEAAEQAAPSCKSNFTKCANIREMANNYKDWGLGEIECKWAADKAAKYGTPEWSWMTFTKFGNGNDPVTGSATLIDDDVKFQNGFGAMVHSEVHCEYDFRAKKVINVSIQPR